MKFAKGLDGIFTQVLIHYKEAPTLWDWLKSISPGGLVAWLYELEAELDRRESGSPTLTVAEWAELAVMAEDLLETSMGVVTAYFSGLKKDWMPVLTNLADATFTKLPHSYIQRWL